MQYVICWLVLWRRTQVENEELWEESGFKKSDQEKCHWECDIGKRVEGMKR